MDSKTDVFMEERKIGEITKYFLSGDPFEKLEYLTSGGIPVISKGDIDRNGRIRVPFDKFISSDSVKARGYSLTNPDEIIVSTRDLTLSGENLGILGRVPSGGPYAVNQGANRLLLTDDVDKDYFVYWCRGKMYRDYIRSCAVGSTQIHLRKEDFLNATIYLPPLPIQRQIAAILSAFDDKIELNRQMNRTLEQMARSLFKSWFVDFDPVRAKMRGEQPEGMDEETAALFPDELMEVDGREVPRGWEYSAFDSQLMVFGGGTPKTSNAEFWGGHIPWYSVVDVPDDGDIWVMQTEKTITGEGLKSSATRLLPIGTTIISARGTVGKLALTAVPMAMNQSCYGLFPRDGVSLNFTYFSTLAVVQELKRRTHGAVFDTITRDTLKSLLSVLPSTTVLEAFEAQVGEWTRLVLNHCCEVTQLAQIRDTLLPQLMPGELKVEIS